LAQFALPESIDYVLEETNSVSVGYVGHSEGTITMFAALIDGWVTVSKLNLYVALAPIADVGNVTNGAMKLLAHDYFDVIFDLFFDKAFDPDRPKLDALFAAFCLECPECCANVIELICGKHQGAFNGSRLPVVATHEPGVTSVKNMMHWAQGVRSGKFQKFDYGAPGNLIKYGQTTPPIYKLSALPTTLPTILFHGGADELADPEDVSWLIPQIPNLVYQQYLVPYAHLDFVWCITAHVDFYPSVVSYLQKYAPTPVQIQIQ